MKAIILSAGLGTRLRPLTNTIPKALVKINDKPLLEIIIKRLKSFGFDEIIVNVHYFADMILAFLKENKNFDCDIKISDEREILLDTGGGIKEAKSLLDTEPFLVYNVDILTDLDLRLLYESHIKSDSIATLAIRSEYSVKSLLFNPSTLLSGWTNLDTGERKISRVNDTHIPFAFSGIHIISPKIFDLMTEEGVFSIIDVYLRLAKDYKIRGYNHSDTKWIDIGTPEKLQQGQLMNFWHC